MLKVGVGPSSSHTLGPWRAVQRFLAELDEEGSLGDVHAVQIRLYGSLALTGRGHCTDQAISLALLGYEPETVPVDDIPTILADLERERHIELVPGVRVPFDHTADIQFYKGTRLPGHANGMVCRADVAGEERSSTYYSVGGGFVVKEGEESTSASTGVSLPYPAQVPAELAAHCKREGFRIADMVRANESAWRGKPAVRADIMRIWGVMQDAVYRGCHTEGTLPGGLEVVRRAAGLTASLLGDAPHENVDEWVRAIRARDYRFKDVLTWVSTFAMAVNEENANLGRVVTAPTNGAAGVIPAVLMYHICFSDHEVGEDEIADFLLVAGEIGTFFKKGATISAAMGGCQAEIGVSSAMAAAALCEALGGTVAQTLMAAEIAMEHHLGMTCDPIGGLVQVPCIERNTMGAIKAINAAELAIKGAPERAKVTLDEVILTMRETAEHMSDRFKETSEGGLAVNVSVRVPEC